jgi:hypothetical protein
MYRKMFCALAVGGALLSPPAALAGGHGAYGRGGGYWSGDPGLTGEFWGGRRAWTGAYGWEGSGYYAPPYGWSSGHGSACWRWWYGQWVWSC